MKKIIFAALSVLMILSLVGCGEHINYTANKVFSKGDIAGDMNEWGSGAWLSADDDKYEYVYEFTALKDMDSDGDGILKFKVRSTANKWDTGDFGNATLELDKEVELKSADFGGPEAKMTFEASHKYRITVSSKDGSVFAKLEDLGLDVVPMPFVLNGMAVSIDGAAPTLDTALMSFEKDLKGNLTYKVQFKATATEHTFAITDVEGKLKYTSDKTIELKKSVDLKVAGDKDKATKFIGLKADSLYDLTITTTPAGKVSVKLVAVEPVTITGAKVIVSGLPAELNGATLYFTGDLPWANWPTPGDEDSVEVKVENGAISVTLPDMTKIFLDSEKKEFKLSGKFASAGWSKPEILAVKTDDNPNGDVAFTLTETNKTVKGTYKSKVEVTGESDAKNNGWQYFCDWVVE